MADLAYNTVLNIFSQLAKRLTNGKLHSFWYTTSPKSIIVWTRSLKTAGIQKTNFLMLKGELLAISDVQICSKDELSKEMNDDVLIHYS